ncbi:cell wall-binding protein [Clostridium beijerinckii]|nr:cell wall-binding protein [Clostridium beijerinckii]
MNKNLRKIIAVALALGTFSAFVPATNFNLLTEKVYAADTNDEDTLDSLELYDKDGDKIKYYDDNDYKDRVDEEDAKEDEVYYAKTSFKTIRVEIDGPGERYVKIFNKSSDSARGKDPGDDITLDSDSSVTTLEIKIYGEDTKGETVRNNDDDDDDYDLLNTYRIKVKYNPTDSTSTDTETEKDASDYDSIYLERLSVDGKMIELKESQTKYTYNVDSDVDSVVVRATPEDEDDDDVTINGKDAKYDDNFKVDVDLKKGTNSIEIEVEDGGKSRVYTLIINRGQATEKTEINSGNITVNSNTNKWLQNNGRWQYTDSTGNPVRNIWIGNYYLLDSGYMATGWLNYGGNWYYLGIDGAKKTGWQKVDGMWYHLDSQGKIQTGWFKDTNGKYYYLSSFGGMVYNTTIDGYRLGADGAWIGR